MARKPRLHTSDGCYLNFAPPSDVPYQVVQRVLCTALSSSPIKGTRDGGMTRECQVTQCRSYPSGVLPLRLVVVLCQPIPWGSPMSFNFGFRARAQKPGATIRLPAAITCAPFRDEHAEPRISQVGEGDCAPPHRPAPTWSISSHVVARIERTPGPHVRDKPTGQAHCPAADQSGREARLRRGLTNSKGPGRRLHWLTMGDPERL